VDADACKAFGSLTEGVHVAGYTAERAFRQLEWLLEEDRWQQLGVQFADVNAFLDSVRLDNLRIVADQRKRIAERIKQLQPAASNRAIGRTIGVDESTVRADTAGNPAPRRSTPAGSNGSVEPRAGNPALSGTAAARVVERAATKHERTEAKKEHRADRERDLAEATIAAAQSLGTKLYGVIYADPPWRFEPYSRDTGMDRAAENHYPTMTLDRIKEIEVPAAGECALFLWATIPMLEQALEVMSAWGFGYKSQFVWKKDRAGTGYWTREKHELLLIGTRGEVPAPAPGEQYESVIEAARGEHSAKPFCLYEMIEEMFPTLPRLEMFARGEPVGGWDRWGNEVVAVDA
jgi:N6-adenosine-specific RNA methylase IME4